MKIAILGAGAMGSMVGAYLKKGGGEVYFVDPYEAHMKAVRENGLQMRIQGKEEVVRPDGATGNADEVGVCDAVIVLVKGMDTRSSVERSGALMGKDTIVVTLQNGLGNVDILKDLVPEEKIGYGLLKSSATLYAPGKIFGNPRFANSHAGMYMYPLEGKSTRLFGKFEELVEVFGAAGFIGELHEDIDAMVWDKLYNNIVFNCPCAILQISPQDFISHPMGTELYKQICKEVCEVATAKGIPMDADYWWEHVGLPSIPKGPIKFRAYTSAIHDVSRKRKTEADFLNGAIYREGQKFGIPTPYNETIWRLTKILEDTYDLKYVPEA